MNNTVIGIRNHLDTEELEVVKQYIDPDDKIYRIFWEDTLHKGTKEDCEFYIRNCHPKVNPKHYYNLKKDIT